MSASAHLIHNPLLAAAAAHPAGAYLFAGPAGSLRFEAARELMRNLNCKPDGGKKCRSCLALDSGNHPDLLVIAPTDKPSVSVEQVRELGRSLVSPPYQAGGWRLAIIREAQTMSDQAQNALLKTLEEPPDRTVFVLITERENAMLPTIRSRAQTIRFLAMPESDLAERLTRTGAAPEKARQAARLSGGLPGEAARLLSDPSALKSAEEAEAAADMLVEGGVFEALIEVPKLAGRKEGLAPVLSALERRLRSDSRAGTPGAAAKISAHLALRGRLREGVAPKTALEAFILEVRNA